MTHHAGTLSPLEQSVLEFDRLRWKHPGARDDAIWMLFGIVLAPVRAAGPGPDRPA